MSRLVLIIFGSLLIVGSALSCDRGGYYSRGGYHPGGGYYNYPPPPPPPPPQQGQTNPQGQTTPQGQTNPQQQQQPDTTFRRRRAADDIKEDQHSKHDSLAKLTSSVPKQLSDTVVKHYVHSSKRNFQNHLSDVQEGKGNSESRNAAEESVKDSLKKVTNCANHLSEQDDGGKKTLENVSSKKKSVPGLGVLGI